jgi:hypothetical protein
MSHIVPDRANHPRRQGLYDFYHGDPYPAGAGYSHSAMLPQRGGPYNGPLEGSVKAHLNAMGNPGSYAFELGEEGGTNNYGKPRTMKTTKQLRKEKM